MIVVFQDLLPWRLSFLRGFFLKTEEGLPLACEMVKPRTKGGR